MHKASWTSSRAKWVNIASNPTTEPQGDSATSELPGRRHADFETLTDKPGKRPSPPGEDVFWCITVLAELASPSSPRELYVLMMLDQPRSMAARLQNAEPLPPDFQMHWFDDNEDQVARAIPRRAGGRRA